MSVLNGLIDNSFYAIPPVPVVNQLSKRIELWLVFIDYNYKKKKIK